MNLKGDAIRVTAQSNARITALTSVVIVSANSGAELAQCVTQALASDAQVEIIVVDNDSQDGSIEPLQSRFSNEQRFRLLRNATNLGFGTACNRGAALANGDTLLFLNPDCFVAADTIHRLRGLVDVRTGAIGVLQTDSAGNVDPASRRRDPLFSRALITASGLARFEKFSPRFAGVNMPLPRNAASDLPQGESVDAISGALMLLPLTAFEKIGGFDESYFLHCEDLDLCRRLRDAGYEVICANDVRVIHAKGGSSGRRPVFVAWHKHRGMWHWFTKFDPAARNPVLRTLVWCGLWGGFVVRVPALALRRAFGKRSAQ